jgi:ribosomal protein L11 methyltransferase
VPGGDFELAIAVPQTVAEELAALWDSDGVEIRDSETLHRLPAGRAEVVRMVSAWEVEGEVGTVSSILRQLGKNGASVQPWWWHGRPLLEADWRDVWRAHFHAHRIAAGIVVRPSWERAPLRPGEIEIVLDPGRAFGTGTHATTRLCMRALATLRDGGCSPRSVLDGGCGSGILSIAAAKLWPEAQVLAIDVDPDAVAVARENAIVNRVDRHIDAQTRSLEEALEGQSFELIVANIQADVLLPAAQTLAAALAADGRLVLSGILDTAAGEVTSALVRAGLTLLATEEEDEWRAPVFSRSSPSRSSSSGGVRAT